MEWTPALGELVASTRRFIPLGQEHTTINYPTLLKNLGLVGSGQERLTVGHLRKLNVSVVNLPCGEMANETDHNRFLLILRVRRRYAASATGRARRTRRLLSALLPMRLI